MIDGTRWRRSEYISIGTVVMVAGWIWYASAKVQTYDVVCDPNKGNDALDRRMTTMETHVRDKDDEILRQLGVIFRKIDRQQSG